jgi:hypothetical protein
MNDFTHDLGFLRLCGAAHCADPREQRLAVVLDDQHQRLDRCLQFRRVMLALRQLGDEVAGITSKARSANWSPTPSWHLA